MTHRVLVADDSTTIQKVIKIAFARHGLELLEASSLIEALSACARRRPALLIVDATLPGTKGPQDFKKLREDAGGVPVILFVGSYDAVDEGAFRAVGIHNILKKPFDSVSLVQLVEDLLQVSPLQGEKRPAEGSSPSAPSYAPPKHPTMYVSPLVPPPPPGPSAFASPEGSIANRGADVPYPPPPPAPKVGVGGAPPFTPPHAAVPNPPGHGTASGAPYPPPPPSPSMVGRAGVVTPPPPPFSAGARFSEPPPPIPGEPAWSSSNLSAADDRTSQLAGLPDLPFDLPDLEDQEGGFVSNGILSSGDGTQYPVPPAFPGMTQPIALDGARRGQKVFDAADIAQGNRSTSDGSSPLGAFPPPPASGTSALMDDLTRDLPELVRRVVEDYCERHFKSLAREFIASELRRLADEKARHLVDN